jgi:TolB-like protein/Tfp pilus assembly protein PilF
MSMIGRPLAHYRIASALGAGGMGEVYRATDTKLGRDVALKVLPADMAHDAERLARFQREARAVAALNHPNIVTIFSVEESEGIHFLTMELVEGQSLDRLIPSGGLPADKIVEIAQALSGALAAAHDKGIIHRDLKPANVMVTGEGRVKVLDFGLAKETRETSHADATLTSASNTRAGVVMGTPAYMSPEQISGRAVDHRTDIFSLGIVLYEMATGRRPFEGQSSAELASSILRDTPSPVTDSRADLPAELARIIQRCLGKSAADRFPSAQEIRYGLRGVNTGSAAVRMATATTSRAAPQADSGTARADEGFWVAVLPFKCRGASAELEALAEGLSEEIVTGLSRFSYLRVIARSSTSRYAHEEVDIRAVGREIGARYVMEGSLRQAGTKLRISVQLVDAGSGAHLWAETYNRDLTIGEIFTLQDDITDRVVATVADPYGVLVRSMAATVEEKPLDELTASEWVLRYFGYRQRLSQDEHAKLSTGLELFVERESKSSDVWACLAQMHIDEFRFGFNRRPDSLDRALQKARRAVELDGASQFAHQTLALVRFFRRDIPGTRTSGERAMALNPRNSDVLAELGLLFVEHRDFERGTKMTRRAMDLNPHHAGWYHFALVWDYFERGDYEKALEQVSRVNMPGLLWQPLVVASVSGLLGRRAEAAAAAEELLKLDKDFGQHAWEYIECWNYASGLMDRILDGLAKAGMQILRPGEALHAAEIKSSSEAIQEKSIAVLPFANLSADPDQDYFSDGLAEEIINLLAQMAALKVIARTSSFAFRGKEQDVREIAKALNVTHILEGSVRRSGSRVRVTAQLIDAADGSHLWSERYDRELNDIFAIQDEISAAIARALRVKLSRDAAPERYAPKLDAYEAFLKARHQQVKVAPESLELARRWYEQACELDPAFGMAHVGLGLYWLIQAHFGRHPARQCLLAARAEAQRALQIAPSLPEAHALLGLLAAMHDMDWAAAEKHFDFPMAKQANFEFIRPMYSGFQFLRGNVEQAVKLTQRAIEEDPLEVWPRMNLHAFLQAAGRDTEALEQLKKVLELDQNQVVALVSMAMLFADRGDLAEAIKIARRAYAVGPWLPDTLGVLAGLLWRNGEKAESKSVAAELGSGEAPGEARANAIFHLLCGDIEQGTDWAEKAVEQRDGSMMYYLRFVVSKGLRASHRWPKIAKMINLPA